MSLAGAVTALGALLGYWLVERLHDYLPYFLVVASSSFIYVALADLIPQLHEAHSQLRQLGRFAQLVPAGPSPSPALLAVQCQRPKVLCAQRTQQTWHVAAGQVPADPQVNKLELWQPTGNNDNNNQYWDQASTVYLPG